MPERLEPTAFQLKRLPLPMPASLAAALDCASAPGGYCGVGYDPDERRPVTNNGADEWAADALGWQLYLHHPACRRWVGPAIQAGREWLVFDWDSRRAFAGPVAQMRRFLDDRWLAPFADEDLPELAERRLRAEAESMLGHLLRHPELFRRAEHIPGRPPQYVCRLRLRLELDAVLRRS